MSLSPNNGHCRKRSRCRSEHVCDPWLSHLSSLTSLLDAPNVLKKELSHLLTIQGEFEGLEKTVQQAARSIKKGILPKSSQVHLQVMMEHLATVRQRADQMYSTLNVNTQFPSLVQGVDLEFVRRLFLLRQLKATVQKKATSTMWEFDKLDQASGGKDMALGTPLSRSRGTRLNVFSIGTKIHQHVRGAMTKKSAALTAAVSRYNTECAVLIKMRKPHWPIPAPELLPTKLSELKVSTTLMQSVWITAVDEDEHRWIREAEVRESIRAMHKVDRCQEEVERLALEADNMYRWFCREVKAIWEALHDPQSM